MKLPKNVQSKLEKTESSSFTPIPAGVYDATVKEITLAKGPAGPYWKWVFTINEDGYEGRQQFLNTSHSDESLWKLKQTLEAFDADMDVDSEDLHGLDCKLVISESVVGSGPKKGQPSNNVDAVLAADADDEGDEPEQEPGGDVDLDALGKAADKDDDDAIEKLEELAEEADLDPDEYDTWVELAQAIEAGSPVEQAKKAKSKGTKKASTTDDDFDI